MEKVARGIYITDDVWPDELFILQTKNPTVIFPVKLPFICMD